MAELCDFEQRAALEHWFAAAESDAGLAFELTELIFDFFNSYGRADRWILGPGFWVLTAWAMLAAALSPEHGAETWADHNGIMLEVAGEANIAVRHIELRAAEPDLRPAGPFTVRHFVGFRDGVWVQIFVCGHLSLSESLLGASFLGLTIAFGLEVVLADRDVVLDASSLLGLLAIIPALERADEVTGDAAETFEATFAVTFFAATVWTSVALDDAGEAADWVAVNWVVDGAVADANFLHVADSSLKGLDVFAWIAVHFDVGDVAGVTEGVVWRLNVDLLEGGNWVVNRNVEGVGVEVAISDTLDCAEFLAVHLGKAAGETFSWGREERVVEVHSLGFFIAEVAHVTDDIETDFLSFGGFAMVLANHSNERFGEADEADRKRTVLDDVAEFVVWFELLATNPVALAHEEWEVLNSLVALEFEALVKLIGAEAEFLVEFVVEAVPIWFFALAEADTVLDTNADEVQSGEGTVAAAEDLTISFLEAGTEDASAAAHGCELSVWIALLVVLEVVRRVEEAEVREETLSGYFHAALKEIVVWIFWVVVDAFLDLENGDWKDWRLMMAKTVHGCFEKHLRNEAARFGSIRTEVNRGEWNLSASTAVHSIEVVDEAFHCLEGLMLGVFLGLLEDAFWNLLSELLVVAVSDVVGYLEVDLLASEIFVLGNIALEALAVGLVDAWCEGVVEVRNGLTAVLLVLVGLEDNGGEGSGSTNGIWRAEEAVTGVKTMLKHLKDVGLAASQSTGCHEVEIVNMNVAMIMSIGEFWLEQAELSVFLGTFCAELEHLAHGGVAVDVCVTTLHIGIFSSVGLRNGAVNLHKFRLGIADAAALSAIFDVGLGGALEGGFHENFLDDILDLFDRWNTSLDFLLCSAGDLLGDVFGTIVAELAGSGASLGDSLGDFI